MRGMVRAIGVGRIFSTGGTRRFFQNFFWGVKSCENFFSHSKLRKQPFLLKILKSGGASSPLSDAHGQSVVSFIATTPDIFGKNKQVPRICVNMLLRPLLLRSPAPALLQWAAEVANCQGSDFAPQVYEQHKIRVVCNR